MKARTRTGVQAKVASHSQLCRFIALTAALLVSSNSTCITAFSISSFSPSKRFIGQYDRTETPTRLYQAKPIKITQGPWYPLPELQQQSAERSRDENEKQERERQEIEIQGVELARQLVQRALDEGRTNKSQPQSQTTHSQCLLNDRVQSLVQNRFLDLACRESGERGLENLFASPQVDEIKDDHVIRAAVMVIQSLCVVSTQVGVKGNAEHLQRMVAHLDPRRDPSLIERDLLHTWDADSVRRLKYQLDRTAAVQLLAALKWKRTLQGAFDLMVALGVWEPHEDVALLRSGFPLRFPPHVLAAAESLAQEPTIEDPDALLGLRKDLRHLKAYTIDGASTMEIDDGLSVEKLERLNSESGEKESYYRIWVHIADAERIAPPGSDLFETARQRITSLYLPRGSISMFPALASNEVMSLRANQDAYALSMGVEVHPDGSLDESSIEFVPSIIRVTYRLTYDEADEMLEEGIGYAEEWELGALLDTALARRQFRIGQGSTEGFVPNPIPYSVVNTYPDKNSPDGVGISIKLEVSHNAGRNQTAETGLTTASTTRVLADTVPASASFLLVTELMILAGEGLGRWKRRMDSRQKSVNGDSGRVPHSLRLPFRTQPKPDYRSRAREVHMMNELLEQNVGDGLCFTWFIRRFLQPVKISEMPFPHSGLGLECYVQWTSPIRRFSDLQVHAAVKRFLRRKRLDDIIESGQSISPQLKPDDFGIPSEYWQEGKPSSDCTDQCLDPDINYFEGVGLIGAARTLQRQSQQYWIFEYLDRLLKEDREKVFQAVVLGCIDPENQKYAIYVYELGLEHRYAAMGRLDPGTKLRLKVQSVYPQTGLLTFVQVS